MDLASIGVGGISIVICAGCFLDLDDFFFDLSQGRGNLDSATRCVQEVVAGEIQILKQHKRKKLWRSQRGEAYI